jgi:hypothetical protein
MAVVKYLLKVNGDGIPADHEIDVGIPEPNEAGYLQHILSGLTPGEEYSAEVGDQDAWGNFSGWSEAETETTPVIPEVPGDFAQLVHWNRVKSIAGASESDPISPWEDIEGSADLTSAGANRPLYRANSGQPYLEFASSSDYLEGSQTSLNDFTIILIIEVVANPSDYNRIFEHTAGNGIQLFTIGSTLYFFINGSGLTGTIPARPTGFMAIYLERIGTTGKLRINGVETTGIVDGSATGTPFELGASTSETDNSNINVKEQCVFNAGMTGVSGAFAVLETYIDNEHGELL